MTRSDRAGMFAISAARVVVVAIVALFVFRWLASVERIIQIGGTVVVACFAVRELPMFAMSLLELIVGRDIMPRPADRLSSATPASSPFLDDSAGSAELTPRERAVLFVWLLTKGAFVLSVVHFIARSGLGSDAMTLEILGLIPVTGYLLWRLFFNVDLGLLLLRPALTSGSPEDIREGRALVREGGEHMIARMIVLLAALTEAFAAWTAFLFTHDVVHGRLDGGRAAFAAAERLYVWHLLDAVPALEIPRTLHWSDSNAYDDWTTGALVLG